MGGQDASPPRDPQAGTASALAIDTARAEPATGVPLAQVQGLVTLPPEARVAVTVPFAGTAVRIFVVEGQEVARGTPLALVRAAEPVGIGADIARARAEVALAEARAARLTQLAEEGIIAAARAEEAGAALAQARATYAESRRLAALSGAGADGSMTLRSPIAGRIAHVGVETGGGVDGLSAPFVVEAGGPYLVDLPLPARLAGAVRPGMAVEAQVPAGDGAQAIIVGGRILSVAPSLDPQTRSVVAKAAIGDPPGVVAGQYLRVTIRGAADAAGVSVPARALTRIAGADHVFVRGASGFEPREVLVLASAGGTAIIAEGIEAGDEVATSSIAELKAAAAE